MSAARTPIWHGEPEAAPDRPVILAPDESAQVALMVTMIVTALDRRLRVRALR